MAQTSSLVGTQLRPVFKCDSGVVTIPATSSPSTVVATMILQHMIQNLNVSLTVAVHAIDTFIVEVMFHPEGPWVSYATGITSTPAGLILAASGTLASQAAGTGWFIMDVRGLYGVQVSASGSVDDTTTVRILAGGS